MKNSKKAQLATLQALVAPLIGIAIVLVVGFLIMAEVHTQAVAIEGAAGYASNGTREVQAALDDIPGWLPIIVITIIGAALLGLVAMFRNR